MKKEIEETKKKKITEKVANSFPDAIFEDDLSAEVGSKFIIRLNRSGKQVYCECVVKKLEGDLIHTWNDTLEQWFTFGKSEAVKSKMTIKRLP